MKRLMLEEQERLLTLIANLENELKYLPPGTFFTVKNGNYVKWFCYDKGKKIHIPKSDAAYASALARATFLRLQLKEAIRELEAVKAYLRNCIPDADTADAYMFSHEGLREMLPGNQTTDYIQNWINKPYQKNPKPYKGTLYKTQKGDLVKSLAEKEIADSLYLHNLPYRYECGFSFDNRTFFYPDFTILHPHTLKIFIWEHFGMGELNYYQKKNADKMYTYFENGFVPGLNLICTASTDEVRLTKAQIEKNIQYYFGDAIF